MLSGVPGGMTWALHTRASGVSRGSDASGAEAASTSLCRRRSIDQSSSSAISVERRPVHSIVICLTARSDVRAEAQPEQRRGSALPLSFSSPSDTGISSVLLTLQASTSWRAIA